MSAATISWLGLGVGRGGGWRQSCHYMDVNAKRYLKTTCVTKTDYFVSIPYLDDYSEVF